MHGIRVCVACASLVLLAGTATGQTQLDLKLQARNVDFSSARSTKPWKAGTQLPPTCEVAETFFKTDAPAGSNVYVCSATNVWVPIQSNSASTGLPTFEGPNVMALFADTSGTYWGTAVKSVTPGQGGGVAVTCQSGSDSASGDCSIQADLTYLATQGGKNSFSGPSSFPAAGTQYITSATDVINVAATTVQVTTESDTTLTSTPTLADGFDGQLVYLMNVSGSAQLMLQDETARPGTNLRLSGPTATLQPRQVMMMIFSEAVGDWVQIGQATSVGGGSGTSAVQSVFGRTGTITKLEADYNLADLGDVDSVHGGSKIVQTFGGGSTAANDCARFDANGNLISAGAPCATAAPVQSMFGRTGAITKQEADYNLADLGDVDSVHGASKIVQTFGGGSTAANDCARFDASGNLISAGAPCAAAAPVQSMFGRTGAITKQEADYNLADLGDVDSVHGASKIVQTFGGGSTAANDCARFDASGNLISAGAPCAAAAPVQSMFGRTGAITKQEADYNLADLGDVDSVHGASKIVQTFGGGATAANDCAKFDANGNLISAGAPCSSGGASPQSFIAASATGGFTPATASTSSNIATASIPANTLAVGDRVLIRAVYLHQGGTALNPRPAVSFGGTPLLMDGPMSATDTFAVFEGEVIVSGSSSQIGLARMTRSNGANISPIRSAPAAAISGSINITFDGRLSSAGESLTLEWYSIEIIKR